MNIDVLDKLENEFWDGYNFSKYANAWVIVRGYDIVQYYVGGENGLGEH